MNQTSNIWQVYYMLLLSAVCVPRPLCCVVSPWKTLKLSLSPPAPTPVLSFTSLSSSHVFVPCLSSWHSSNNASLCPLCFSTLPSLPIPFLQLELPNSFSVKRDWFFLRQLQNCSALQDLCMCSLYNFFVRMLTFIKTLYQSQGYLFLWQIFSKKRILPRWCYASLMNVISYWKRWLNRTHRLLRLQHWAAVYSVIAQRQTWPHIYSELWPVI